MPVAYRLHHLVDGSDDGLLQLFPSVFRILYLIGDPGENVKAEEFLRIDL